MDLTCRRIALLALVCIAGVIEGPKLQAQTYVFGTASYAVPNLALTSPPAVTPPIVTADFNQDGIPDLAALSFSSSMFSVEVFLGKPDGTFAPGVNYSVAAGAMPRGSLVVGDFNGDGTLDLIAFAVVSSNNPLTFLAGKGDGTFQPAVPINVNLGTATLAGIVAADFNGDGKLDLAFSGSDRGNAEVLISFGNGDGTFQNPATYSADASPYLATGDFNGDGKPDIAVSGETSSLQTSQISVLINQGDGTFASGADYTISGIAQALATADLNGDGKLDLIAPTGGSSAGLSTLLGNGDGTFGSPIAYTSNLLSYYSISMAVADFNGDGKPDLALTDAGGQVQNRIAILLANGDGSFKNPPLLYSGGLSPAAVVALDANGDGKPDLAVAGGYGSLNSIEVLVNRGDGSFPGRVTYPVLQVPYSSVSGDFNRDGKPDIATTSFTPTGGVSALLGNGDGTFRPHLDSPTGQNGTGISPGTMVAGDFNGDGKLDLVVADWEQSLQGSIPVLATLLGKGDGTFQDNINQVLGNVQQSLAVGDFNNDGKLDVAATAVNTSYVSIFLGKGNGNFNTPRQIPAGPMDLSPPYHNVLTGDFNNDGKLDLAVATDNGVAVLLGDGDGTFQSPSLIPTLTSYDPMDELLAAGDFNGDGRLDILKATQSGILNVALGNGDGTFQNASSVQIPSILNFQAAVVGDFNADGKQDVAFASQSSNVLTVLPGNGDGTFGHPYLYDAGSIGNDVRLITKDDFNGDGAPDLALANISDNTVSVFLNSAMAAFAPGKLTFISQEIGSTSAAQTVTLTNSGSAPLTITGISTTGPFSETDNCSTKLAIGQKCQAGVSFSPTASGPATGTLTFTDNASVTPQTLKLSGTGTGAHAEVSPPSLTFGDQILYTTSAPQTVTLTNTGVMPLTITSITASSQFGQTNTCGGSLASQASCTVSVTFTPSEEGAISGHLTFADNSDGGPQIVTLHGSGKGPVVNLSTTSLSFANQLMNTTSAAQTVTLSNTGVLALTIAGITVSGDFAQTSDCGNSVAIGASCTLSVTFTPSTTGPRTGSLEITDNAGDSPQMVTLTGTGIAPAFSPSAASLSFGNQFVGTASAPQTLTVANSGTAVLAITAVALGGPNSSEFTLSADHCTGADLAPAATCSVTLTFTPNAAAPANASLVFTDNAAGSPQSVALSGAGYANPVPLITQPLIPDAAAPGDPGFTLTVNGTRFVSGATVEWNGSPLPTTFVSGSQLTATVPASDVAVPGTASVSVMNAGPGAAASNILFFPVTTPIISPLFVNAKGSPLSVGTDPGVTAAGDFNGDGKLDLAVATGGNSVAIFLGNGDGTFSKAPSLTTSGGSSHIVIGDFNGDGIMDLAVVSASNSTLTVFLGNGDGTFTTGQTPYLSGSIPEGVAVDDFNGDGKLDLATIFAKSQANILLGNGDGTFTHASFPYVGLLPAAVTSGDFNGDGKLDLALADAINNEVNIVFGNGDGTFTPAASSLPTGNRPDGVAAGDFNGDGELDLAVANGLDNTVTILLGNGDGTFTPAASSPATGDNPIAVAAADMNGDGVLDLVVTNSVSGNVTILLGKGDGSFTPAASTAGFASSSLYSGAVAVGDFNGDGRLDLAMPFGTASTSVLLQAGNGLSPASMGFGNEDVGLSSPVQTAALVNAQTAALNISHIAVSGDFSQTNNCPAQLAPGAGCTVSVTFTPAQGGTRTGTLTVTDDANGVAGTVQTTSLSGTGVLAPLVTFSPTGLSFPAQPVGITSTPRTVTVTNTGTADLVFDSGPNAPGIYQSSQPGDFAITSDTCGGQTIAPQGTCSVSVTFTPSTGSGETAEIAFVDNAGDSPQYFQVGGTGVAPTMSLSATSLTFPSQSIGSTSTTQSVTVTNTSAAELIFGSRAVTVIGTNSADFVIESDTCSSQTIAPNGTCVVNVAFTPSVAGSENAQVSFADNAANSPQIVDLVGTGVQPTFTVAVSSGSPATATVSPGQTASYSLSVSPVFGFNQTVTFACVGAPSEASCSVTPGSVTLDGSDAATVSVSVATTAPALVVPRSPSIPPMPPEAIWLTVFGMLGLLSLHVTSKSQRTRRARFSALGLIFLVTVLWASCGGGGGGSNPPVSHSSPGTPAGTYTLKVSGVSGSLSSSTNLTLTVN